MSSIRRRARMGARHGTATGVGRTMSNEFTAIIERARQKGARELILHTSPRLKPANNLYRSLGFRVLVHDPVPPLEYKRNTISMALDLTPAVD